MKIIVTVPAAAVAKSQVAPTNIRTSITRQGLTGVQFLQALEGDFEGEGVDESGGVVQDDNIGHVDKRHLLASFRTRTNESKNTAAVVELRLLFKLQKAYSKSSDWPPVSDEKVLVEAGQHVVGEVSGGVAKAQRYSLCGSVLCRACRCPVDVCVSCGLEEGLGVFFIIFFVFKNELGFEVMSTPLFLESRMNV